MALICIAFACGQVNSYSKLLNSVYKKNKQVSQNHNQLNLNLYREKTCTWSTTRVDDNMKILRKFRQFSMVSKHFYSNSYINLYSETPEISLRKQTYSSPLQRLSASQLHPMTREGSSEGTTTTTPLRAALLYLTTTTMTMMMIMKCMVYNRVLPRLVYKEFCTLFNIEFQRLWWWWTARPPCLTNEHGQPVSTPNKLEFYKPHIIGVLNDSKVAVVAAEVAVCCDMCSC